MNNIKVSILIPAFNAEEYIDECLHSIMSQTLKEIEVIIFNDGSTDKTGEIADRYAASDERFHVIHQPHQGVSNARNVCLSMAKGKYVGFVDSDDYVTNDAFEQLFLRAETYLVDIVLGSILYSYDNGTICRMDGNTEVFSSQAQVMEGNQCFRLLMEKGSYVPMVCGNLYLLSFIKLHQLHFDATFHEDEYFSPYALFYAKRVIDLKKDFYFYRQHSNSIMHSDNLKIRANSLWIIGDKLKKFVTDKISMKEHNRIGMAYQEQANTLCNRAKNLYEKGLYSSTRKCLFVISEASTAAQYGIGTYVRQLCQCFDPSSWDVNVVVMHALCKEVQWKIEDQCAYYEIPVPNELQCAWTPKNDERYCKSVFYYLASRISSPRDVYCHFNFVSHYDLALLFKEKLQAKNVFTLHYTDWSFDLLGDKDWFQRILSHPDGIKEERIVNKFEHEKQFMLKCCDKVIAIAQHSYDMLKDLYGIPESKLVYIPNGLKDEYRKRDAVECRNLRKKYGFGENDILIIFAGRLNLVKGVVELIEAFKLLHAEIPDAKLIIAGTGNFTRCFESANPFWSNIVFTGFIPKEQLYELYAIAQVGVVPSIHEEFGYVALEMMMNELPIIVNKTTGLREIVKDGEYGFVFDFGRSDDIQMLKEALITVLFALQNEDCKVRGRNRVLDNYSLPIFQERVMNIYTCVDIPYR